MTRILNVTEGERGKYLSSPVQLMTGSRRLPSTLALMYMTPWFPSLYHRIIQFGRDLRRSFFQPPPQSMVTYQTGLLRALSSWILKTSKDGDRLSAKLLPLPDCLHGKSFFFISGLNFSSGKWYQLFIVFPLCTPVKSLASYIQWPFCSHWQVMLAHL